MIPWCISGLLLFFIFISGKGQFGGSESCIILYFHFILASYQVLCEYYDVALVIYVQIVFVCFCHVFPRPIRGYKSGLQAWVSQSAA